MRPRRFTHTLRKAAALVALGALLCALAAPAVAAEAPAGELALQSVDTSAWPNITLRFGLPASLLSAGNLRSADFTLTENGADVTSLSAGPVGAGRVALDVVLLIDTSGSMDGKPLVNAKAAAKRLVEGLDPKTRVAVMSFNSRPGTDVAFTADRGAISSAIDGMTAAGSTALYDALAAAAGAFSGTGDADRAIVLLSDGGDTVSGNTLDSAATSLVDARAALYAVALKAEDLDAGALLTLSRATGGRLVEVTDSAGFAAVFEDIARQLVQPYEVVYTSLRPPAKELEVDLTVSSRDGRATLTAVVPNPDAAAAASAPAATSAPPSPVWPAVIALIVFAAAGLLVAGIIILTRPEPNTLAQLRYYEQLAGTEADGGEGSRPRNPDDVRERMTRVAGSLASRSGFETAVRTELERAGLPLRPVEYMMLHVGAVLLVSVLVQLISGSLLSTAFAAVVIALGPIALLERLARRRTEKFQAQLPDVLNLLAGSLRAGWGLLQAVGIVVNEVGEPAGPEFARVATEARLGIPLEEAFAKMAKRMGSEDFRWAVSAIAIQREVGGNLAEVLDLVADTVRERSGLRQQVRTLTSEGRLSAIILTALPFIEAIGLWMVNPNYISGLLSSSAGLMSAGAAVVLMVVGVLWLRRVIRIEV